ncbi:hypothetical protein ADP65_00056 [Achromobacter phage phiAxp-3]|uniref:Uncharacterized protein n=1 Tax=Achromobacter phage phiAxp-3 TaxID=1664247 RepID=A0A0K2FIC5_9CAUD|nr:hypothetical protein ADP65_00056 [Achromobacter phage phiAxp-3]ALA45525.1 hypothetical protein ADP65_00056 [Achromobacter phage phiAxp-3]
MATSFAGSGLTIPPFQYQLGGGNGMDFGSLSSYSTQGASMFGGMGGGNLGLQMPGAGGTIAGAAPGIGGGGPLSLLGGAGGAAAGGGILGGLGMNIPTLQLGLGMLSSLGGLYGASQANKLARDSFNFTKDVTNTNLNNQIKSYNTALEDRSRSRAIQEGRSQESAQEYIDRNRLSR